MHPWQTSPTSNHTNNHINRNNSPTTSRMIRDTSTSHRSHHRLHIRRVDSSTSIHSHNTMSNHKLNTHKNCHQCNNNRRGGSAKNGETAYMLSPRFSQNHLRM